MISGRNVSFEKGVMSRSAYFNDFPVVKSYLRKRSIVGELSLMTFRSCEVFVEVTRVVEHSLTSFRMCGTLVE